MKSGYECYGRTNSPCLDCSDRAEGCHATCEAYRSFQEVHEQERADIFHKKHMENLGYGAHYVGDRQFLTKVTEARKRKARVFKQTKK